MSSDTGAGFPLRPQPDRGGLCPRCAQTLRIRRLGFGGWRTLLEGRCERCGHDYVQDLPAGHGLVYPATLDLSSGEVIDPANATWFSSRLRPMWEHPNPAPVRVRVENGAPDRDRGVLLNCLDPIYGHSVLKLLNAQRHLDDGLLLLIPGALEELVPPGTLETWIVDEPLSHMWGWLTDLDRQITSELERFGHVELSPAYPHPHPSTYRIEDFVADIEPKRVGTPSVILSVRDDRRWGRTGTGQARRIREFVRAVEKRLPEAGFVAVGTGAPGGLPGEVSDRRSQSPSSADERAWLALFRGADLVVGVHGSHMLLPSGLARATLELQPRFRIDNVFQATIVSEQDPLEALISHRVLYGNDSLSDLPPRRVADLAISMLTERDRFSALMLGPAAGRGTGSVLLVAASPDQRSRLDRAAAGASRAARRAPELTRTAGQLMKVLTAEARARRRALPAILTDRRGLRFELERREEVAQFLVHRGHFERDEIDLLSAFLEPGQLAIDVGANIGAFTAAMARAVGPEGAVHSFEPFPDSRRRLDRTLELNGLANVRVNQLAVGGGETRVRLVDFGPGYESWATTVPRTIDHGAVLVAPRGSVEVEAISIDRYCVLHDLEHVHALKVDVEGGEPAVLNGARRLLEEQAIDLVLVEISDNTLPAGTSSLELVQLLEGAGLRAHVLKGGRLVPFQPVGHVDFANVVAAADRALERVRAAQPRLNA